MSATMADRKESLKNARGKAASKIKDKCSVKVLRIANIVSLAALGVWGVLRLLWCFGVGPLEAGFNFFFFISTFYLLSFIAIHAAIEIKPDHEKSIILRTYFNFLNNLVGRGFFLIFMALIILEKQDQLEIICAIFVISVGICTIVVGWDKDKTEMPSEPWNPDSVQAASRSAASTASS